MNVFKNTIIKLAQKYNLQPDESSWKVTKEGSYSRYYGTSVSTEYSLSLKNGISLDATKEQGEPTYFTISYVVKSDAENCESFASEMKAIGYEIDVSINRNYRLFELTQKRLSDVKFDEDLIIINSLLDIILGGVK